jgi:PAT family acetyl-CoA transporter-like MFS transporter 1
MQIGLALGTRAPILLRILLSLTTTATLGSIPFILREHLSYSQLATFALSAYPYSLKLIWSPIVDAVYFPSVGRRKSWIIPMQTIIGSLMLWMSFTVQELMDNVCAFQPLLLSFRSALMYQMQATEHVVKLTFVFTTLVFIAATQGR